MQLKAILFAFFIGHFILPLCLWAEVNNEANSPDRLDLPGKNINAQVNRNLTLAVQKSGVGLIWESSKTQIPNMVVRNGDAEPRTLTLASAANFSHTPFDDGKHQGHKVHLSGFDKTDVELELVFAIDATADELLIQVAQTGGRDTVVNVDHFYRFEKPVAEGGYLVLPHGSGYMIASDCTDPLPVPKEKKDGLIGARWTLPLFGMMRDDGNAMCAIVETWWDCNVEAEHVPSDRSVFDLNWQGSLGKLSYPRRSDHPVTRRQGYEIQNACFAETRRRGVMPAAELARFWCMADCDYFFFTDWARDRLSVGDPIPLFQLVFNDCYSAGFSGGGYAFYAKGHDWPHDGTPRLYELMFASAPAYNWLPEPHTPIRDWDSAQAQRRWTWLKRWSSYYRAVTLSEMVSHKFLSPDRKQCRIEFANGVTADFNLANNKFRVKGVKGFNGQWETPEKLPDYP